MSDIRLDSHGLLEYNSSYGVLICRECQYAIQKSAVDSHLLRHKIYRGERQKLLSSIAQLDILEPELVPLPTSESQPIDALPIISGYRCVTDGCGNLCASSKRMKRHRSEVHGLNEPTSFSSYALPVKLQTFFRGTKIRYFEVTSILPFAPTADDKNGNEQYSGEPQDEQMQVDTAMLLPPQSEAMIVGAQSKSSVLDIDLETMTYFHHFVTTTSLTLPGTENYWQATVVPQALQRQWLMCGLLSLSACHMASVADNQRTQQIHRQRAAQLHLSFLAGLEETCVDDLGDVFYEESHKAAQQIGCILDCVYWASDSSDRGNSKEMANSSGIQSFLAIIRNLVSPNVADRSAGAQIYNDCDYRPATYAQASRILNIQNSSASRSLDARECTLPSLLNRLTELPSRMAEVFGKPDEVRGVLAPLSAIASLIECCDISFASKEVGSAWNGMTLWLIKVPAHFNVMVSNHTLVALVILAYWAGSLVQRAEDCGCWFLKGSAKKVLMLIAERLPPDNRGVQGLVADLFT